MDWLLGGHGRHTLREGRHGPDDIILYRSEKRKGHDFMTTVSHTFSYKARDDEVITEVLAEDQWDDDTGGNPELISGGVGCREVTVKVTSRVSRGFKFHFYVYGYKRVPHTTDTTSPSTADGAQQPWVRLTINNNSGSNLECVSQTLSEGQWTQAPPQNIGAISMAVGGASGRKVTGEPAFIIRVLGHEGILKGNFSFGPGCAASFDVDNTVKKIDVKKQFQVKQTTLICTISISDRPY